MNWTWPDYYWRQPGYDSAMTELPLSHCLAMTRLQLSDDQEMNWPPISSFWGIAKRQGTAPTHACMTRRRVTITMRPCCIKTLPGRLELPTLRLTASRSNQLSYGSRCEFHIDKRIINTQTVTRNAINNERGSQNTMVSKKRLFAMWCAGVRALNDIAF